MAFMRKKKIMIKKLMILWQGGYRYMVFYEKKNDFMRGKKKWLYVKNNINIAFMRRRKEWFYEKEKRNDFMIKKKEWFHEKGKRNYFIRRKNDFISVKI